MCLGTGSVEDIRVAVKSVPPALADQVAVNVEWYELIKLVQKRGRKEVVPGIMRDS